MKSLFDTSTYNEVIMRLNNLTPQSQRKWGKMDVAQMLAHSIEAFKVPLSKKKLPRVFIGRLLGWIIKSKLYNDIPWKQNLPTSPAFIIKDQRIFETEKKKLYELIEAFYTTGPDGISKHPHPFFGSFTSDQWGKSMYKHLDHHFQQFGV
ncbi:MAG: DUF1569 domain-containing protein [Ferruginibacter sp.]|nr:DUF1569 domain-containing protein [Ferruginibacter sp.]